MIVVKEEWPKTKPYDKYEEYVIKQLSSYYDFQYSASNVVLASQKLMKERDLVKWDELELVIKSVLPSHRLRKSILDFASNIKVKSAISIPLGIIIHER